VVYIDKIQSPHTLRADLEWGNRVPIHCTSVGKAIAAFLPEKRKRQLIESSDFKSYTTFTRTGRKSLETELESVTINGYAMCNQEYHIGITAIGAPIFNHDGSALYGCSISGPTARMTDERIKTIQKTLKETTHKMSEQLGYSY